MGEQRLGRENDVTCRGTQISNHCNVVKLRDSHCSVYHGFAFIIGVKAALHHVSTQNLACAARILPIIADFQEQNLPPTLLGSFHLMLFLRIKYMGLALCFVSTLCASVDLSESHLNIAGELCQCLDALGAASPRRCTQSILCAKLKS